MLAVSAKLAILSLALSISLDMYLQQLVRCCHGNNPSSSSSSSSHELQPCFNDTLLTAGNVHLTTSYLNDLHDFLRPSLNSAQRMFTVNRPQVTTRHTESTVWSIASIDHLCHKYSRHEQLQLCACTHASNEMFRLLAPHYSNPSLCASSSGVVLNKMLSYTM